MNRLISEFDSFVLDQWEPLQRPTAKSISHINKHFGIKLPELLIEFAMESKSFSSFFLGLGADIENPTNIISYNSYWSNRRRTRKKPTNLVIFNNGFMNEDFNCFDKDRVEGGDYGISFWSPAPIGYPDQMILQQTYSCFDQYIEKTIEHYATRNA